MKKPLAILVADATIKAVFWKFFARDGFFRTLECGDFDIGNDDIFNVPGQTDGGLHRRAHELLRRYLSTHERALVVLDQQFGGERAADVVRRDILANLTTSGWSRENVDVVVIDPEIEVWLWKDNPNVWTSLGCDGSWLDKLQDEGKWLEGRPKPQDPKGAIQEIIRKNQMGSYSAVYSMIASKVSVKHCTDESFVHFRSCLQQWFPPAWG